MTAQVPNQADETEAGLKGIEVRQTKDHVEVSGLSVEDVKEALRLAHRASEVRVEARIALEDYLNTVLLESHEDLVSSATQRQVQRTAALRQSLLAEHGAETHETLAQLRDSQPGSVRAWVSRARDQGDLFTVKFKGRVLIPRVQIDGEGNLDPAITPLVRPLLKTGLDGWSLWAWLTSPTGRLSGRVPADLAHQDPDRAQRAAELYATDLENERDTAT